MLLVGAGGELKTLACSSIYSQERLKPRFWVFLGLSGSSRLKMLVLLNGGSAIVPNADESEQKCRQITFPLESDSN